MLPTSGPMAMPASSPAYTAAKARPRRSIGTAPEMRAKPATVAAPAPTPWQARRTMAPWASMGSRNEKLATP